MNTISETYTITHISVLMHDSQSTDHILIVLVPQVQFTLRMIKQSGLKIKYGQPVTIWAQLD